MPHTQDAEFLAELYREKAKYWSIAGARSVLSAILPMKNGVSFGKDPLVSRLIRGVFKWRPSLPKHTVIHDTNVVLEYIKRLPHNNQLMLEALTKKPCMLLCILSGQRSQTIPVLNLNHMHRDQSSHSFYIPRALKTTSPSFHQTPLQFEAFPEDELLCIVKCLNEYIVKCLNEYIESTRLIRENAREDDKQLIISYAYPNKPVISAIVARYIKLFLMDAGIDITVFTPHSTRAASTSKANNLGLSIKDIAKAAGWKGGSTFQRYYKSPITKNLGKEILQDNLNNGTC